MKSIAVPAVTDSYALVIEFVEEELARYECSSKTTYQLEASIEEIVVNIASYAGLAHDDKIEIRCEVLDDPLRVVLQFLDGGIPFDPLVADDPDISPEGLENREGGLGIFMVKKMMDDVSYSYEGGKNTLTILKSL